MICPRCNKEPGQRINELNKPKKMPFANTGLCRKCYKISYNEEMARPEYREALNKKSRDRRAAKEAADPEKYRNDVIAHNKRESVVRSQKKYQKSEKARLAKKLWEQRNIDKVKAHRKRMKQNKRGDLIYRFSERISKTIRASLNKLFIEKPNATFLMLGVSQQEYCDHLSKYLGKPCEDCESVILTIDNCHIDHIIPRDSAKTLEDVLKLNTIENLRCICPTCNVRKSNKVPENHQK